MKQNRNRRIDEAIGSFSIAFELYRHFIGDGFYWAGGFGINLGGDCQGYEILAI